jgi:hypothetical protein
MLINMKKVFEDVIERQLKKKVEVIKIDIISSNSWKASTRDHGAFTIVKETDGGFSVF